MVRTLAICHSYLCSVAVCISLLVYLCVLFIYLYFFVTSRCQIWGKGVKNLFLCVWWGSGYSINLFLAKILDHFDFEYVQRNEKPFPMLL